MIALARTVQTTGAKPEAIFALWSGFDDGIEWAELDDTFAAEAHYTLRPKGGPKVSATIEVVEPSRCFIDVSHLPGAKLRFDHAIAGQAEQQS